MNSGVIASHARVKEILNNHGLSARKNFGQNFLTDTHVIEKILKASEISNDDLIIEVGPGLGALTEFLAQAAGRVIAVEIDRDIIPVLSENLASYNNVEIIGGDILKTDLKALIGAHPSVKVVANLPYYITTPVIMRFLEEEPDIKMITVMVQKEVADRLRAVNSTKDYGALSVAVQYYSEVYLAANVPRNCFIPRPNVDSAVVRLTRRETPPVLVDSEAALFELVKAAFSQRRKTLVNCLFHAGYAESKEELINVLHKAGLDARVRGEELGLEQFAGLVNMLLDLKV